MKEMVKKSLPYVLMLTASFLLLFFLIQLGFKDENVTRNSNDSKTKMQYALVNEDQGANFEGEKYSLGTDFVTLINKDTTNRWETTTRSIAISGVESGQFDAQIVIPKDFSEKLLSLQAINPEQAIIEYQVRDGQNEITNQSIQNKVNDILRDFNQRVIQMYFSSIVGNLVEAQQNVNQIAGTQIVYQTNLETNIYNPFKELPTNYTSVLSTASILDEENKLFTAEQEAFVKAVQSLLESNNKSLEATSETTESVKGSVGEYTKEANEKIKKSIEQFNEQFELQKEQLATQWENDSLDYKGQFDQFNNITQKQLNNFYIKNDQDDSGVYADFLTEAKIFQETQTTRIKELRTEITELQILVGELTSLKKQIAATYFNDPDATPDTATDKQIRQAIIQLISKGQGNTPKLESNYSKIVEESLTKIPYVSLKNLVDELVQKQILTVEDAAVFYDELTIVRKYANDFEKTLDTEANFSFLESVATHPDVIHVDQKRINLSLDTSINNVVLLQSKNATQGNITFNLTDYQLQEIINELNKQLLPYNYQTQIIEQSQNSFTIAKPTKINDSVPEANEDVKQEDAISKETKIDALQLPDKIQLSVNIPINWYLTESQKTTSYNLIDYSWDVNNAAQIDTSYAVYIAMDQPLIDDTSELMKQFQLLNTTSQQIVTLFGNPKQNLSIQTYAEMLAAPENEMKTILELADRNSIYWMYDNITDIEKEEMITDQLFTEYKKAGNKLYSETAQQITKLQKIIGTEKDQNTTETTPTLYGTLNLMTVPEKLLKEADKLNAWFSEANLQVNTAYGTWKESEKVVASSVINEENPHPIENDTAAIDSETENLVKTMQTLMQSSKETSVATVDSAAKVKDVAPTIKELKDTTAQVQDNAQNILTSLSESIEVSNKTTKENENYAKTFEKVLTNTRNGGADNPQVFNFLSSPIQSEGMFGTTRQVSLVPYYATLIGAILLLTLAIGLQGLMKKRTVTAADILIEPTRRWQNVPNVIVILTSTVCTAMVFSVMLVMSINLVNRWTLFSYTFLVFVSGLLIVVGCIRQFKKTTLYVYGACLGLFLILTPLLGIATKPGSFSNWLYRFSPLQNIQNGFTALVNGGRISWISYAILLGLAVLGVVLNLYVRPEEKEKRENVEETRS